MKQKQRIALLGMVAVALILAACGGDSGNNSSESEEDSSSSGGVSSSSSVEVCTNTYGTNTVTDCRDNQTYKTVVIGTQTWMAENLNYVVDSSWCYNNSTDNCVKYGRLYSWESAMTACPTGWHLPSTDEWQTLYDYVDVNNGDDEGVGTSLKSSSGWNAYSGVATGTDRFGFSALPAGYRRYGSFNYAGNYAYFWPATENNSNNAYNWSLSYNYEDFYYSNYYNKYYRFNVRCLKDS